MSVSPTGRRSRPRLGLFLQGGGYAYQNEIVHGAHEACRERDLDLFVFSGAALEGTDPRSRVYALAGAEDLDGVIVVPGTMRADDGGDALVELFQRFRGVPLCTIGSEHDGIPSLCVDNLSGVRELTRHLIEVHGRRRVAFVTGNNHESKLRLSGYRKALGECGVDYDPELVIPGEFLLQSGERAVATLFDGEPSGCDAIITANDWMAMGALQALEKRGLHVPDDVSLVGFDDVEEARFLTPPLTTVRQPPDRLGAAAVSSVLELMRGQPGCERTYLPTENQIRQSCGCYARAPSLPTPRESPADSADEAIARAREDWTRRLESAVPTSSDASRQAAESLVDAFSRDVRSQTEKAFLGALERLIENGQETGNVPAWHHTVSALRGSATEALSPFRQEWAHADFLLERGHVLVGAQAERVQARRRLDRDETVRRLQAAGADIRTAVDLKSLCEAVERHFPRLAVNSAHVMRPGESAHESELMLSFDARARHSRSADWPSPIFRSGELVPARYLPPNRHSMIVLSLSFKDEYLGYVVMEIGPRDASVFESLAELLSTALKASQMSAALVEAATARERAEKSRLTQELDIASRIQTAILPKNCRVRGLEIGARMLPATEVGGDYYDVLPVEDGCWLGIGDVAGHGLPTGLVMMMIQSIVATSTRTQPDEPPSSTWNALNSVLYENVRERLEQDEHATFCLLRYRESGRLVCAGAHEPVIVYRVRERRCELIEVVGGWVAVMPEPDDSGDQVIQLEPGDVMLLYTDGITEALNANGEQFGTDRLCELLERHSSEPTTDICDHVLAAVRSFMVQQDDDMTLLVSRYHGRLESPASFV